MKKGIWTIVALLSFTFSVQAVGVKFHKGSWAEALERAHLEDKLIFVDAYTTWCGPCKKMTRQVFPQKNVGDYFNDNFINVKLDMEKKGDGIAFRQKHGVRSFPTLLWVNSKGEVVHKSIGAKKPEQLVQIGEMVVRKFDKSIDLAKEYEDGNRDPQFIYKYVKALNQAGKPSLKYANTYLRTQKDLSSNFNLRFILEAASEADSGVFDKMIANKSGIIKLVGQKAFDVQIAKATRKTALKGIEFESIDLIKDAKKKMKKYHSNKETVKAFNYDIDMISAENKGDTNAYMKAASAFAKKAVSKDASKLFSLSKRTLKIFNNSLEGREASASFLSKAVALEGSNFQYLAEYALLLEQIGKKGDALNIAERALVVGKEQKQNTRNLQRFIQKLKA